KIELTPAVDFAALDAQLDKNDVQVLVVCSKHNIHYLTGGYRFFWFDYMDAVAKSRYLPYLVYFPGKKEATTYIGDGLDAHQIDNTGFSIPRVLTDSWFVEDSTQALIQTIKEVSGPTVKIGTELDFLPAAAYEQI